MNASINAVAKRYRYTGKERDEETGLYYHGARYYIPWLCRWMTCDPLEAKYAGMSAYNYGFNNPIKWQDADGMQPGDGDDPQKQQVQNPNGPGAPSNPEVLKEVIVTANRPETKILVETDKSTAIVILEKVLENGGTVKDVGNNTVKLYKEIKKSANSLGLKTVEDDGMKPLKTVTREELAKLEYIKNPSDLLKEGAAEVAKGTLALAGEVSTAYDIGRKGPANVNPATGAIFEEWCKYPIIRTTLN